MATETTGEYTKLQAEGKYDVNKHVPEIEFNNIGKRGVRRLDGYEKASGKAIYTRDVVLPGMLYARILMSPYAHARIKKMDTSKAEALQGVRAILRYDDPELKGKKCTGCYMGPIRVDPENAGLALKPVTMVLGDEAFYEGEPVGAVVVADTEDIAYEALKLIDIEWEELPFILDQEEALKPGAPVLAPNADSNLLAQGGLFKDVRLGDVEKGFREAEKIIEFSVRRWPYLWAGAEPTSVIANWKGDKLEMWIHQQQPHHSKMMIADALNIHMDRVSIHTVYHGGAFGERCNPPLQTENGLNILAATAAKRTQRPVKVLYTRHDNFYGASGDEMVMYCKVGAKKDGTITAVQIKNVFAVYACTSGFDHLVENTSIPNIQVEAQVADVSKPPHWWFRCEQQPNVFCLNEVFNHVAADLGLDPAEVALRNDGCEGHSMAHWMEHRRKHGFSERDSLKECVEVGKKAIDWDKKWHAPGAKKLPNGKMHGLGFAWTHEWDDARGTCSVAVMIENDGTVNVIGAHSDIGLNPWTSYCQIVADELGVKYEHVNMKPHFLDVGFALMSPDGSCNLCSNGNVVRKAAAKAKKMLLELAAQKFKVKPEELDVKDSIVFVKADPSKKKTVEEVVRRAMPMFDSVGFWTDPPVIAWAWHTQGIWGEAVETDRPRWCRQAHFLEIEVDTETGEIEVTNVVNANDVGKAISPETVEGQMYGGTYMAVGRALTEELVYDPRTGVRLNADLLNYKYATLLDCGPIETPYLETGLGHGPYGACGIAEDVATVVPYCLNYAVYNAIGKWIDDYPITPDKVLKALGKI